jgi:hypothetical protein
VFTVSLKLQKDATALFEIVIEKGSGAGVGFRSLIVDFAAVSDASDAHETGRVVDDVNNAPVADSDPPLVLIALELFVSGRPWVTLERL